MEYCELSYSDHLCSHLKKSSGRYFVTPFKSIKNWEVGEDLLKHMDYYVIVIIILIIIILIK